MCDYCGCRRSGPTSELAAEHEHLLDIEEVLHTALHDGTDAADVFDEFARLLQMHAAKEEVGLFVHAKSSTPLGDQIDALCGPRWVSRLLWAILRDPPTDVTVHADAEEPGLGTVTV